MKVSAPKALITGADGQIGVALKQTAPADWQVIACGSAELDVTRADMVREVLERERPSCVIHTAAFTGVDAAERELERAEVVNSRGAAQVAEAAHRIGCRLLHLSTDFVFDGAQGRPYSPTDQPNPLGAYGRTKLAGEREVTRISGGEAVVVRTAWVYSAHGRNFVRTMLDLMRKPWRGLGSSGDAYLGPAARRGLVACRLDAGAAWYPSLDRRRRRQLVRLRGGHSRGGAAARAVAAAGADSPPANRRVSHPRATAVLQRARQDVDLGGARRSLASLAGEPATHASRSREWLICWSPVELVSSAPTSCTIGSAGIRATGSWCSTH
jgi:nucleoside-diphosphate-sugar epimerase